MRCEPPHSKNSTGHAGFKVLMIFIALIAWHLRNLLHLSIFMTVGFFYSHHQILVLDV